MNLLTIKMTIMRKMRRVCEGVQEVEKYLPSWKFTELTLMMALRMRMRRRKSWTSPNQLLPTSQTKKEVQKATKLFANKSKVIKLLICLWPLECPKQGGILTRPLGFYFSIIALACRKYWSDPLYLFRVATFLLLASSEPTALLEAWTLSRIIFSKMWSQNIEMNFSFYYLKNIRIPTLRENNNAIVYISTRKDNISDPSEKIFFLICQKRFFFWSKKDG